LAAATIAIGAVAAIATLAFDGAAGGPPILGLPPGEFVAVILAPVAILVAAFAFAVRQQALDRRHDVAEE
jgi:uncharacterized membrane protein